MGYKRHVIAPGLGHDTFSLAIDETRAVFRLIAPRDVFKSTEDAEEILLEKLKTTEKLASPVFTKTADKFFKIDGQDFCIMAEVIIDKTASDIKRLWVPGSHLVTWFDGFMFHVTVKGALTYFDCRNTAEYIRHFGAMWLFDLWVRNPDDPVTECARSITTPRDALVITNVDDLGEEWAVEDVMTGQTSKWLNLGYELTPSSEVIAPEDWVTFTLKIKDGKTGELATDVTWDGFIIEPVDGYAPHKRLSVTNGVGTFKMKALGLEDGDTMRVKINHRFFTSRAEAIVNIQSPSND